MRGRLITVDSARVSRWLVFSLLAFTAALGIVWSSQKLMWNDEFLSFYTDSVPTAAEVVRVQLHTPISLDPPTYHLLSHASMDAFGHNAFALRLPALCGFLLMEIALFLLVRRVASERAAVITMVLPILTASFRYAVEGRPYGLLLGLYAMALTCWYAGARARDSGANDSRKIALSGLALCIVLAITSHYFGVLILVSVSIGELTRTVLRRRIDWPVVLSAVVAAIAGIVMILPFQHALAPYRAHYYMTGVSVRAISQGFRELFVRYNDWPIPVQRVCAGLLLLGSVALLFGGWRRFRARPAEEPTYFWTALLGLAALPFFSFLFGRFVTHTMEVRYVIAAVIPFLVVIGLLLETTLRRARVFYAILSTLLLASLAINGVRIEQDSRASRRTLQMLAPNPAVQSVLQANPAWKIYTQSLNDFFLNSYYLRDGNVSGRFSLIYDGRREVEWLGHNTNAVTAAYMQHFTPLSVTPYCSFAAQPKALLVFYDSGWEWIGKELAATDVPALPLGKWQGGELFETTNQPCTQH